MPKRLVPLFAAVVLVAATPVIARAQASGHARHAGHAGHAGHRQEAPADSNFAALQQRGKVAMGVDQYTSVHRFDSLKDGGRIELQRASDDTAGVRTIRTHLQEIAAAFAEGDFSTPAFVHMRDVPGTADMARLRSAIRYAYAPLPGGGEVRITTTDPQALRAVHAFMAFQRGDHRSGGASAP